uniref:Peptidase S1 domain-containing protein n=1 Tax=Anopheles minimus TaxID=112268 RepID=A0A182W1T5_9DIPT
MDCRRRIKIINWRRIVLVVLLTNHAYLPAAGNTVGSTNQQRFESCNNNTGICVEADLCKDGKLDTDRNFLLTPRNGMESEEECTKDDGICCGFPEDEPNSGESAPFILTSTEEPDDPESRQCGQRANFPIADDQVYETHRYEFPWNVALFSSSDEPNPSKTFLCGGTLIEDFAVLTTAECVSGANSTNLSVELGRIDLNEGDNIKHQKLKVDQVIVHTGYVASNRMNNIALLILKNAAQSGRAVNRVCLADKSLTFDDSSLCYVVGWSEAENESQPDRKLKLPSSIASVQECTASIRRNGGVKNYKMPKQHFCTRKMENNFPCERAPGSGFVCEASPAGTESHYFLLGIASHSIRNCPQHDFNDVFLSIPDFIQWVDGHMKHHDRSTIYYRPNPSSEENMSIA